MSRLLTLNTILQGQLFPALDEELGTLSTREQKLVRILELIDARRYMRDYFWCGVGRKPSDRAALLHAFIAKALWNLPTTRVLIEHLGSSPTFRRLCGWDSPGEIPSESVFSRAFAAFAEGQLPQQLHETLIQEHYQDRLVGHISRDATEIRAREKAVRKPPKKKVKKKRGRPRKGTVRPKRRLELQLERGKQENLSDLPWACDVGCKRNSKGHQTFWVGYKLHLDVADGDVPISALLTSASTNDSQAAIPLGQMSAERCTWLYELMDSGYDMPEVHEYARLLGRVPIIDHNPRRGVKKQMSPAQAQRFRERSSVERVNASLKDHYGGRTVRVRGAKKVMCHIMFGLLCHTVIQFFNLLL